MSERTRGSDRTAVATPRGSSLEKKGGQVLMGPRQPKPQVQPRVPPPPPRGR